MEFRVFLSMEVEMILTMLPWVGYLIWKFRLVTTALWRIENGTSPMGCSWLVFDRGKVQLIEKAPNLFVNLHVMLTKDYHWTIFISEFRQLQKVESRANEKTSGVC